MPAALGNMSKHYCARLHEFWENILPTNFTNLHEFFALQFNGDLVGRTNFHESNDRGSGMSFLTTTGLHWTIKGEYNVPGRHYRA